MVHLNIFIPESNQKVSDYAIDHIESRLDISFNRSYHSEYSYRFSYQDCQFSLPATFINKIENYWCQKKSIIDLEVNEFELDHLNALGFGSDKNHQNIDVLGTIFFCLSRYEEHVATENDFDFHNRFKSSSSLLKNYLDRPIVDELIDYLVLLFEKNLKISVDKHHTTYCILPTHDVDRPFEFLYYSFSHLFKRMGGDVLLRKSPREAIQRLKSVRKVKNGNLTSDPNNTFDWIMSASEQTGRISTFHFLADVTNPTFDHDYKLTNPEIQQLLQEISDRGHNIGLHPSFKSSEIPGQVKKEAEILRTQLPASLQSDQPLKSRYHYLRWNTNSVTELEKAQIEVDQTLGFAQKPGFRCGTSLPFPAFNFDEMRASSLIIEPLIVMEQSLISPVYMNLRHNLPEAWNIVSDLKEKCRKHGGNFTILWHNDHLKDDDLKDFYLNCIS